MPRMKHCYPDKAKLKETILTLRAQGWSYREIGRTKVNRYSRQQFKIVAVSRAKDREISTIKRADARNTQTFGQSHDRGIREIESSILILLHNLLYPNQVSVGEGLYLKPSTGAGKPD